MTFDDLSKNGRAIAIKAFGDAINIGIAAVAIGGITSLGMSIYRLQNGRPINPVDEKDAKEEEA